ncbi:MAG: sigma-54-dependent Fis family transcriptional regulator [Syntrophorhabdaceae bacterium]|nr:sigma-54-dependent Fis family transcriptional regulator [Syntrophorhabdales bacterium]MBP9561735.1 sigma-54-dependent Fis family transcriptional regulator [Syntrophorhabdaceae bacterium]
MIRVLIVDDEVQLAEAFKKQLSKEGMDVTAVASGAEALMIINQEDFDVAVLDIKLNDIQGVDLLSKMRQIEPNIEVIMLTGYASIDTAIRSMKLGAYDYLTKPCKISELSSVISKAYEKKSLKDKNILLKEHIQRIIAQDEFVGNSKQMQKVKDFISLVAPSDTPVLIQGETGTGKELAARAIHSLSLRAPNPFVVINSSALQESMLESELFGYKKGAFTGAHNNKPGLLEIAHEGTFFIDEIGDMNPAIQAKILRVLELGTFMKLGDTKETRVDVRFIFATNKDLTHEIIEGRFRKDLFFRMNAFVIQLPSLREKKEDIPLLAEYFLNKFARAGIKKQLSERAKELLKEYNWPGNVRELANVIERACLISIDRMEILPEDLPEAIFTAGYGQTISTDLKPGTGRSSLAELELEHIRNVLNSVGGNKSRAARILGISRKKLYNKLENI